MTFKVNSIKPATLEVAVWAINSEQEVSACCLALLSRAGVVCSNSARIPVAFAKKERLCLSSPARSWLSPFRIGSIS